MSLNSVNGDKTMKEINCCRGMKLGMKRVGMGKILGLIMGVGVSIGGLDASVLVDFQLLTWGDSQATETLPTGVGRKPSAGLPAAGDWLLFTEDDVVLGAGANPYGGVSHNFVNPVGGTDASFMFAPSLSGNISLQFTAASGGNWDVSVTGLAYTGQATETITMNQFLITPGSPAALNPTIGVDGVGNSGSWNPATFGIGYNMDFYFAASVDGDPNPSDVDVAFNNKLQLGYLIPTSALTLEGLSGFPLNDPAGFYGDSFTDYLLNEVAPRLPGDATFLLITQMLKINPDYTELGLPVTTASTIGNTTIAYTTAMIPEPGAAMLLAMSGLAFLKGRRVRGAGGGHLERE